MRLREIVGQERAKILRKKKLRWAEYLAVSIPVLSNHSHNEEWARKLKEKLNSNTIM